MLSLRSHFFNAAFIVTTIVQMFLYAPFYFFLPHKKAWMIPKTWAKVTLFLQKYIAGTTYEVEGLENLPKGAYIIAPKHQSAWETFGILPFLDDPTLILKRELMWIPGFGWYMAKIGMIAINRGSPVKSLKAVINGAKEKAAGGRQILIFPEGTRREPGAKPDYKPGIVPIYSELNVPVVAIAHNAGLYWPRGNFRRYPGVIKIKILPPIEPGLNKKVFLKRLVEETETACDALLIEAAQTTAPPAMPKTAVERLKTLGIDWKGPTR